MNQGRIWCVVHPTVGLPLFLGSVAGISFIVHACLLTQTTWFPNYWQGSAKKLASAKAEPTAAAAVIPQGAVQGSPAFAITVAPVAPAPGKTETAFVVTVTPTSASTQGAQTAVASPPERTGGNTLALAKPPER